jgi:hypothetical protein
MEEHFDPENQGLENEFADAFKEAEEYVERELKPTEEQQVIKDAATDMIAVMSQDPDPKF